MKAHIIKFAGRAGLSFFSYYIGWWACAFGVSYGYPWVGPALLPVGVALHLYFSPTRWGELLFFAILAVVGFAVDSALIQTGLFAVGLETWAPLWLVSMWILLGFTFESMLPWRQKTWVFLLIGAISGPLTYIWCDAIKIVEYARPLWAAILVHALIWMVLTPVLFTIRDWSLMFVGTILRRRRALALAAAESVALAAARPRELGVSLDFLEPRREAAPSPLGKDAAPRP